MQSELNKLEMNKELYQRLVDLRNTIAKTKKLPSYVIFSNATLEEMATTFPQTEDELLQVKYVTEKKVSKFGKAFLEVIEEFAD